VVKNPARVNKGIVSIIIDGQAQDSNLIPAFGDSQVHSVEIVLG
jgi:hypothetical protein